jgi:large subunit ribosomal protein L13
MKTFSTKPSDVRRQWHVLDATGQPLGRLSTQIAVYLRGKHKPIYAPHLDTGDFVIVVNAAKVRLTGNKLEQKHYYHHSGYPGGLKVRELKHEMVGRPEWVIERAVRGMLPKGPLGLHLFNHLKVYSGPTHPHESQINAPPPPAFTPGPPGSNTPNAPRAESESAAATAEPALVTAPNTPPQEQLPAPEPELALPPPEAEASTETGTEGESSENNTEETEP